MRKIKVFNFKTEQEFEALTIEEASASTGVSTKDIREQLKNPKARVHELAQMLKDGTIPAITLEITKKIQRYEFSYVVDYAVKLIRVDSYYDDSYILTNDVKYCKSIQEASDFLGKSRQSLYNRKQVPHLMSTPICSKNGSYYLIDFGDSATPGKAKANLSIYLARVTDDGVHTYKTFTNEYTMFMWISANSKLEIKMPYQEFNLVCKNLKVISDEDNEALNDEQYSWMNKITNCPMDCKFGFPVVYNNIGIGKEMFTTGAIVVRLK